MCGISGKLNFGADRVERSLIARMNAAIAHRGPDDEGIHIDDRLGLGERRLAIIDLNHNATAPLTNEDRTLWLVFNGEIYNYQELRDRLHARGHRFATESDTEVILHLYEDHGVGCLDHLRGMFAFALWDAPRARLFAARDRMGKKPFVYCRSDRGLIFGSEITALLADPSVPVSPDFEAIDSYLTWQYVPSPQTAFAGVNKLPPAHFLLCSASGELSIERYWSPSAKRSSPALDAATAADELRERLRESVRLRMIADVPLGAFLSGGIDSGLVVALMAELGHGAVKTFSIGLEDETHNELPFARLVAERYGTDHHELLVRANSAELLPSLVRFYGEPFADSSAIPTYHVAQMARQHVTVALSGDGGDESFGGYDRYADVARWGAIDWVPQTLRRSLAAAPLAVLAGLTRSTRRDRLSRALTMMGGDLGDRYRLHMSTLKPEEKRWLYAPGFWDRLRGGHGDAVRALEWDGEMDATEWMMLHDRNFYLPDCLLVKVDIASMANSLEVRCPLLDHTLVEWAASLPPSLKRDATQGKVLLRQVARTLLPEAVVNKPKSGFGIPVARWLREDMAELVRSVLLDDRAAGRGLFVPARVAEMVRQHRVGERDWSNRLWALVCLELWFREFIDQSPRAAIDPLPPRAMVAQ